MKIYKIATDFYRGTVPGETKRIPDVFPSAKGKTFVARNVDSAKWYGSEIHTYRSNNDAKILYENSPEFWKMIGRRRPPNNYLGSALKSGERLKDLIDLCIRLAIKNRYDAISFESDTDVGTVIINNNAFEKIQ
jgi:hypothetical protein